MGLRYAVVTSVNRDDQPDGGAHIFARTIEEIRGRVPGCKVEVLIPDFRGDWNALGIVLAAQPDVLNHNTETVPDRKSTRLNSSHSQISYAVFCLKKKKTKQSVKVWIDDNETIFRNMGHLSFNLVANTGNL